MKKSFFTRGELLLVTAASGILLALASGVSGPAGEAKVAACAEVMRGLERSLTAWENAHGGTLISANRDGRLWGRQLRDDGYFAKFHDGGRNQPRGLECPAETRVRREGDRVFAHPAVNIADSYDYGLNWFTHAKLSGNRRNPVRAALKAPARLIRMTEGTKFALMHVPANVTSRHGEDVANVLFEDGHIEFMTVPYRDSDNYHRAYWRN